MKVSIKQLDYMTGSKKEIGSFVISRDDFIAFILSKNGKKVLKEISPPDVKINHPSVLQFVNALYDINSQREFWIFEPPVKTGKSYSKVFLEQYLPQQLSIISKAK